MRRITQKMVDVALDALLTIDEMAANGMLTQGTYLSEKVVSPELKREGAVCQGHQACFMGSLWIGAGQRITHKKVESWGGDRHFDWLEGVDGDSDPLAQEKVLKRNPGLRLALDAADHAAETYVYMNDITGLAEFTHMAERLFEAPYWVMVYGEDEDGKLSPPGRDALYDAMREVSERACEWVRERAEERDLDPRSGWTPNLTLMERHARRQHEERVTA